jgi:hypothetical protein
MNPTRLGISSISNEIHESILYEQKINEGKKKSFAFIYSAKQDFRDNGRLLI